LSSHEYSGFFIDGCWATLPSMVQRGEGASLVLNEPTFRLFAPDVARPTADDVREQFAALNLIPDLPWIDPTDVKEAVLWLW
jgi:hypothetical protein